MAAPLLRRLQACELPPRRRYLVDAPTQRQAAVIVEDVRQRGEVALREHAERLGDLQPGQPLWLGRGELDRALAGLPQDQRTVLERTAARVRDFAQAQRDCLQALTTQVPGGTAGHTVAAVERAGCYAPGGRFPLPSSVLMTVLPARTAGVAAILLASPRPSAMTLAAAAVAGADGLLQVGGAQAIAALAYGAGPWPGGDVVVGPGNRWVTAAKQLVAGHVAIDMLAGPSELLILADGTADPALIAADLLAQAEHDPDATPILVALDDTLPERVDCEVSRQLADLPTAAIARAALDNGFAVVAPDLTAAIQVCDHIAPEHLALLLGEPERVAPRLQHYGALFIGRASGEVFGDYGAGPNHVLPTAGTARSCAGLSVFTFLRVRTWMQLDSVPQALRTDSAALARMEGLEAHARAAERR